MGLLEDAIREHLELKRRRGASADEVAAEENDALGPPGRPTPLEDAAATSAGVEPHEAPAGEEEVAPFFDVEAEEDRAPAEEVLYEDAAPGEVFEEEPAASPVEEEPVAEHAVYQEPVEEE